MVGGVQTGVPRSLDGDEGGTRVSLGGGGVPQWEKAGGDGPFLGGNCCPTSALFMAPSPALLGQDVALVPC